MSARPLHITDIPPSDALEGSPDAAVAMTDAVTAEDQFFAYAAIVLDMRPNSIPYSLRSRLRIALDAREHARKIGAMP